tara:strand:+ start:68395 stop:70251 length:1857 start_codon:yes stop_codon:yes gene_type:complete
MIKPKQLVATALAAAFAAISPAVTQAPATAQEQAPSKPVTEAGRHALLKLIGEFDPLDTSKLQLVRVDTLTDNWVAHRYGWVIKHAGKQYDLRYIDLGRGSVTTSPRLRVANVRLRDAIDAVRAQLLKLNDRKTRTWFFPSPTDPMHPRSLALVLARACEQRGMHDAKQELLGMMGEQRQFLARDLGRRVVMNMCDPQISWQQLLQQRQLVNMSFAAPRTGAHRHELSIFENVIADLNDKQTPEAKRLLIDDPWLDGNVAFDSGQMLSPQPEPQGTDRPLNALFAKGMAAVPELIALLGDPTATRSLNWTTKFGGIFSPNAVHDQAHAALQQIAGHSPEGTRSTRTCKAAWQVWYAAAKDGDARKMAKDRLEHLRRDSVRHYLSQWPDGITHVLALAEAWPHRMPPTEVASTLLADPRFQKLPRVQDLAMRCFNGPMHEPWRAGFAAKMLEAGVPGALKAVRKTWTDRHLSQLKPPPTHYLDEACVNLRMLMLHGNADDWQTIRASNEFYEVRQRCALVLLTHPDLLVQADLRNPARSEVLVAAQETLAQMLLDTTHLLEQRGVPSPSGPFQIHGVACADAAATALCNLQPAAFHYQLLPARHERHQQLATLRQQIGR